MEARSRRNVRPCLQCGGPKAWNGSRWRCPICYKAYQSAYLKSVPEEQKRRWRDSQNITRRARTPEQRARDNVHVQNWREANRERHRQGSRRWYAANADRIKADKKAKYDADPSPFIAQTHKRKARLRAAVCEHGPDCVTADFVAEVKARPCVYCGGSESIEADHHIPLARAGRHCRDNIVPACLPCNRSKWANDPQEWMETRGFSA